MKHILIAAAFLALGISQSAACDALSAYSDCRYTAVQPRQQGKSRPSVWLPMGGTIERAVGAVRTAGVSMVGIVHGLADKVRSIQSACPGTHVISAVRHTRVAGTRRMSLHASGHAVDVRGPYSCIYAQLAGWPGGYSTDAHRMRHIHISLGGREDGLRFRHGGHRRSTRLAAR